MSINIWGTFRTLRDMTTIAGKYEVVRELGQGGYGTVYLVKHVDIGVKYALKVLNQVLSNDLKFIERFKREAEILVRFSHPRAVQLRDFGKTEAGLYYMAMDFSEGILLSDYLTQNSFTIEETLGLMEELTEVLAAAHKLNIVHRDIKPDNIMIETDPDGQNHLKILDFGIAKVYDDGNTEGKTIEGAALGTPEYMSPEQAAGEKVLDHRVDIYSSGILFYELLAGHVPFKADTLVKTLLMHLTRAPAPFEPSLGIPEYVADLVYKAISKDRASRFSDAGKFLTEIRGARARYEQEQNSGQGAINALEAVNKSNAAKASEGKKKTRILCLDDNEMILNILKHILEHEGYEVFTATECSSIHSYLFNQQVELLISDVQMPGLPGTRVCQMLKASLKDLKIVLFSNIPERDLERLSKESKADDWISKNAKPDEWLEKVRSVLAREEVTG